MRQQLHPVEQSRYPFFSLLYTYFRSPSVSTLHLLVSKLCCAVPTLCYCLLIGYVQVVPYRILPNTDNSASSTWTGRELVLKSQGTCIHLSDRTPKRPYGGYQGSKQALPNASITPVRYGRLRPFARSLTFSQPQTYIFSTVGSTGGCCCYQYNDIRRASLNHSHRLSNDGTIENLSMIPAS